MWGKLVYKFDKVIYRLFYWRWNPRLANNSGLRQDFLDEFRIWEDISPIDIDSRAYELAIIWSRTSSAKTKENLTKLFSTAMWEARNASTRYN